MHFLEAEQHVLGCALLDNQLPPIKESYFQDVSCKLICRAMYNLHSKKIEIDMATVAHILNKRGSLEEIGGPEFLAEIQNDVPVTSHLNQYVKIVKDNKLKIDIEQLCTKTAKSINQTEDIQKLLSKTVTDFSSLGEPPKNKTLIELRADLKKELSENPYGLEIGNEKIDIATYGIKPGRFWILAAYSSGGKTMMAMQITRNIARQNKRVAFYSLEMKDVDVYERLDRIQRFNKQELDEIDTWPIDIITDKRDWLDVSIDAQRRKPDLVVLDFAQIVGMPFASEYEKMQMLARNIQDFCKDTNIPVLLLSQVSNESMKESQSLPNAKGGGDLFAACDVFIQLRWDFHKEKEDMANGKQEGFEVDEFERNIYVAKSRFGMTTSFPIIFDRKWGLYRNF